MPKPTMGNVENIEEVNQELLNTMSKIRETTSKLDVIIAAKQKTGLVNAQISAILNDESHDLFPDFEGMNSQYNTAKDLFLQTSVIPEE